ncbi:MAG: pyridoxamine 5'-phosphate oxidase family protein [Candidatus Paceibacterota bacterium]|jgi:uncharacterized pyridoxamine 5'-phosphate oxidase family protein
MAIHFTKEQVLEFLKNNQIMSIATINGKKPLSSVVAYAINDDFTFYFISHQTSYKTKALITNPLVGFSIWEKSKMLIQADGIAHVLPDDGADEIMDKIAHAMAEVKDFWPPLFRARGGKEGRDYAVFEIRPTWMRALDLSSLHIKEGELPFTEFTF